jgi:hypothetical protein
MRPRPPLPKAVADLHSGRLEATRGETPAAHQEDALLDAAKQILNQPGAGSRSGELQRLSSGNYCFNRTGSPFGARRSRQLFPRNLMQDVVETDLLGSMLKEHAADPEFVS